MTSPPPIRAGWSRTRIPVTPAMLVVDIGSGAFPNPRADILCDRDLIDNRHRAGLEVVIDRPLVRADATQLPFGDQAIDFVIVSHLAEHIDDPAAFCQELARVAKAGYIETPSPLADYVLDEEYHLWRVGSRKGVLRFGRKPPKSPRVQRACDAVYRVFYSAQASCHRPTWTPPGGPVGTVIRFLLTALGATLNRIGVMHTRVSFQPGTPLRWEVEQADGSVRSGVAHP